MDATRLQKCRVPAVPGIPSPGDKLALSLAAVAFQPRGQKVDSYDEFIRLTACALMRKRQTARALVAHSGVGAEVKRSSKPHLITMAAPRAIVFLTT